MNLQEIKLISNGNFSMITKKSDREIMVNLHEFAAMSNALFSAVDMIEKLNLEVESYVNNEQHLALGLMNEELVRENTNLKKQLAEYQKREVLKEFMNGESV